jgi:hypothetical protein
MILNPNGVPNHAETVFESLIRHHHPFGLTPPVILIA